MSLSNPVWPSQWSSFSEQGYFVSVVSLLSTWNLCISKRVLYHEIPNSCYAKALFDKGFCAAVFFLSALTIAITSSHTISNQEHALPSSLKNVMCSTSPCTDCIINKIIQPIPQSAIIVHGHHHLFLSLFWLQYIVPCSLSISIKKCTSSA